MIKEEQQYVNTTATETEQPVDEMSAKIDKLVEVKQLPVIAQTLVNVKEEITATVEHIKSLTVTEENFKFVKSELANVRKLYKKLEDKRKAVRNQILQPYVEFEPIYKELAKDPLEEAINYLDKQVKEQTKELIDRKTEKVKAYYEEVCQNLGIDFVKFEQIGLNVTLSVSIKKLKEQILTFFEKVVDELKLIDVQEHKADILVEYKQTLNVAQSITKVSDRYKAIAEEQARIEAEKAEREKARVNAEQNEELLSFSANIPCAVETPPEEMEQPPIQNNVIEEEPEPSLIKVPFATYGTREQLQVAIPQIKALLNKLLSEGAIERYE